MPRLTEATVQVHALEFLVNRYRSKARRNNIFAQTEVRTHKKYGSRRADGLLAFKHWLLGTYVVSMEAKSFKTLPAIKPRRDDWLLVWNSVRASLSICILSGMFFAFFKMDDGLLQFLLPINVMGASGLVYGYLTRHSPKHKVVNVVKQIGYYPANEKWLAFSQDSLNSLPLQKVQNLETICRYRGIGILVVRPKGKVEIMVRPKYRWKLDGNFLKYYSLGKKIKQEIS